MKLKFIFANNRKLIMSRCCAALLIIPMLLVVSFAQEQTVATAKSDEPTVIQDNSFLMEEAYNQEAGVIQHISFFTRMSQNRSWLYSFTQEWPMTGQKNQFSYTIVGAHSGDFRGSGAGSGIRRSIIATSLLVQGRRGWLLRRGSAC